MKSKEHDSESTFAYYDIYIYIYLSAFIISSSSGMKNVLYLSCVCIDVIRAI